MGFSDPLHDREPDTPVIVVIIPMGKDETGVIRELLTADDPRLASILVDLIATVRR